MRNSKFKIQNLRLISVVFFCMTIFSCKNNSTNNSVQAEEKKDSTHLTELPPPPETKEVVPSQKELEEQIKEAEKDLLADETINVTKAKKMIRMYDTYHKNYYNSFACPDYLFKAGEIAENIDQYTRAADFYRACCGEYGDAFKFRAECMFRLANMYDFKLNDYVRAKETYKKVIEEYPKTQLAQDAKSAIKLMGISDEEMIKKFEAQNKK